MTDEIARLRELLAKATPGPWGMYNGYGPCKDGLTRCASIGRMEGHRETVLVSPLDSADLAAKHEDFELIASAVNALPALLDRLEAAERERDLLRLKARAMDRMVTWCSDCRDKVAREPCQRCRAQAAERRVAELEGKLNTFFRDTEDIFRKYAERRGEESP
jgi:hypothetical protein